MSMEGVHMLEDKSNGVFAEHLQCETGAAK